MDRPKMPSLKKLAAEIEKRFPDLVVEVFSASHPLGGYASTDRHLTGTMLRHPGKGRRGTILTAYYRGEGGARTNHVAFRHNAAETYRHNGEVVDWIVNRVAQATYFEITGVPRWDDEERKNR